MKTCAPERDWAAVSSWGLRPRQCLGASLWGPLSGQRLCFAIDTLRDTDSDPGRKRPADDASIRPDGTPQPHSRPRRCNRGSRYLRGTFREPSKVTPEHPPPGDMWGLRPIRGRLSPAINAWAEPPWPQPLGDSSPGAAQAESLAGSRAEGVGRCPDLRNPNQPGEASAQHSSGGSR